MQNCVMKYIFLQYIREHASCWLSLVRVLEFTFIYPRTV